MLTPTSCSLASVAIRALVKTDGRAYMTLHCRPKTVPVMQDHPSLEPQIPHLYLQNSCEGTFGVDLLGLWCTKVPFLTQNMRQYIFPCCRKRPSPQILDVFCSIGSGGQKALPSDTILLLRMKIIAEPANYACRCQKFVKITDFICGNRPSVLEILRVQIPSKIPKQ